MIVSLTSLVRQYLGEIKKDGGTSCVSLRTPNIWCRKLGKNKDLSSSVVVKLCGREYGVFSSARRNEDTPLDATGDASTLRITSVGRGLV
jgi:hypothetical protein